MSTAGDASFDVPGLGCIEGVGVAVVCAGHSDPVSAVDAGLSLAAVADTGNDVDLGFSKLAGNSESWRDRDSLSGLCADGDVDLGSVRVRAARATGDGPWSLVDHVEDQLSSRGVVVGRRGQSCLYDVDSNAVVDRRILVVQDARSGDDFCGTTGGFSRDRVWLDDWCAVGTRGDALSGHQPRAGGVDRLVVYSDADRLSAAYLVARIGTGEMESDEPTVDHGARDDDDRATKLFERILCGRGGDDLLPVLWLGSLPLGDSPLDRTDGGVMPEEILIDVQNVAKRFCRSFRRSLWYGVYDIANELFLQSGRHAELRPKEFWAVDNVSLHVRPGECLGLIGRNGAGKSTLLKLINGLIKPDAGEIRVRGAMGALIELGAGFHPLLTGRENIYVNASILGISKAQTDERLDQIIDFAQIGDAIDAPYQTYSSGMRVRLGFAVSAFLDTRILLVDEVLAVGDWAFQRKCLRHMAQHVERGGCLILVAHSMHLIQTTCHRAILFHEGQVLFDGETSAAIEQYLDLTKGDPQETVTKHEDGEDSQPVEIEQLEIRPVDGDAIYSDQTVEILLRYRAKEPVDDVTFGFSIWSADQTVRLSTSVSGQQDIKLNIVGGQGEFRCRVHHLPLAANSYTMTAGIYDGKTSWPIVRKGFDDPPVPFQVSAQESNTEVRSMIDNTLIHLQTEWLT